MVDLTVFLNILSSQCFKEPWRTIIIVIIVMGDFEWHEFFSSKCCARRFFLDVKNNLASKGIFCDWDLLGLHDCFFLP